MTYSTPIPAPTPACAAFELLLPLLDTDALTPDEATATREHIAGCAWCRAQCEGYDTFGAALHRHYSSDVSEGSSITLEGIMRADGLAREDEAAMDDESSLVLEVSPIAPPVRRAPRRRWRIAEIAAVLVVGLLAAALLVNRIGPLGGNQPPLKSAAGAVVFTHSVLWGKLQINGRAVEVTTDGHDPLYLPRGQNTLTYLAPPLPALTCTISAPASHSDTCPLAPLDPSAGERIGSDGQPLPAFGGRVVDLKAVPDRLSESQRTQFLAAVQHALDAYSLTMQVQPADHYSTPEGKTLTATQAFPITLSFHADPVGIGAGLDSCAPYCETSETNWSITPIIYLDFVDQYGKPETVQQSSYLGETTTDVRVEWNGAWRISLQQDIAGSTLCAAIINSLPSSSSAQSGFGSSCGATPWTHEGGVLITAFFSKTNASHLDDTAQVLYRAGAFIALDANARFLYPSLPGPSAHELAIARQLGFTG
jgi:hypothetical protein